jgi:hypothetical protein
MSCGRRSYSGEKCPTDIAKGCRDHTICHEQVFERMRDEKKYPGFEVDE